MVAILCIEKEWELGFSSLIDWLSMEEALIGIKAELKDLKTKTKQKKKII